MGIGVAIVGGMMPGLDANNVQVYNNVLSNNGIIPSNYCGGILVGGGIGLAVIFERIAMA